MSADQKTVKFFSDWLRSQCYVWAAIGAGLPDSQSKTKNFMQQQSEAWWAEAAAWDKLFGDEQ